MPNDTQGHHKPEIWLQKCQESGIQEPASQHTFQQRNLIKQKQTRLGGVAHNGFSMAMMLVTTEEYGDQEHGKTQLFLYFYKFIHIFLYFPMIFCDFSYEFPITGKGLERVRDMSKGA